MSDVDRRCSGERGAGLVAGITLMFSFTFLGLVWLARDVDRSVSNESAAQSIAFQAARSAAQSTTVSGLRAGTVEIDAGRACRAAESVAGRLFDSYAVTGAVVRCDIDSSAAKATIEVSIIDGGLTVRGIGVVSAERTE